MNIRTAYSVFFMLIILFTASLVYAQFPPAGSVPGTVLRSPDGYVEYIVGSAPVIITSSHGGHLRPVSIPDRTYGTFVQDLRTQELARDLAREVEFRFGRRPHLVISHLHRIKLDPNREIVEAAQGDPAAEAAWHFFHDSITAAKNATTQQWGRGLVVDVHGHGHPETWVELGYNLSATQLALSDGALSQPALVAASTLGGLASIPGNTLAAPLRGANSIGHFLSGHGHPAVPSPAFPSPAGGNYFSGGYIVETHSSHTGGLVDAVQVEIPSHLRSDIASRRLFAASLADSVHAFFAAWLNPHLPNLPIVTLDLIDAVASENGGRAQLEIRRTGSTAAPLQIDLLYSGRGVSDLVNPPATVSFPAGIATIQHELRASDDQVSEGDESVRIFLDLGPEAGSTTPAELLILDDEVDPDLELYCPISESSGIQTLDVSGNNRHGSILPTEALGPQRFVGPFGGALHFDGIGDAVLFPDFPYTPNGECTISFWFRGTLNPGNGFRYLLSHGPFGQVSTVHIYFEEATGHLRTNLRMSVDHINSSTILDVEEITADGNWHHYALVIESGEARVYLDGTLQSQLYTNHTAFNPGGVLVIGGRTDLSNSRFFHGDMDELRIYARPLSALAIRELCCGLGSEGVILPGTSDDLRLAAGSGSSLTSGPRHDLITLLPGANLTAHLSSPMNTFSGDPGIVAAQITLPFLYNVYPGLDMVWVDPNLAFLLFSPGPLGVSGTTLISTSIPPGLAGFDLILQGFVISAFSTNTLFAASDGFVVRLR